MALKEQVSLNSIKYVQKKYLEALKKFDELIVMKKEYFGEKSEGVITLSH